MKILGRYIFTLHICRGPNLQRTKKLYVVRFSEFCSHIYNELGCKLAPFLIFLLLNFGVYSSFDEVHRIGGRLCSFR